jgi:uncharacterized membrane protein (DUF2068 family)
MGERLSTPPHPAPVPAHRGRRALRAIAAFEALKGAAALAASLGLLSLLHHDLHHAVATLISHFGLQPGDHYPALVLHLADAVADQNRRTLVLLAAGYVTLRFAEAWGLWFEHRWGEWLGALSGALYVPFELRHLVHSPTPESVLVLLGNLAIVAYLGLRLRGEALSRAATAAAAGSGRG